MNPQAGTMRAVREASRVVRAAWDALDAHRERCGCRGDGGACPIGEALLAAWTDLDQVRLVVEALGHPHPTETATLVLDRYLQLGGASS